MGVVYFSLIVDGQIWLFGGQFIPIRALRDLDGWDFREALGGSSLKQDTFDVGGAINVARSGVFQRRNHLLPAVGAHEVQNLLQVLRGASLMKPIHTLRREGDSILLDAAGRLRLQLDAENRPLHAQIDGKAGRMATVDRETGRFDAASTDIVIAPLDVRLKAAIELRRASGHPILLVDALGRLAGLCGDEEIYRGLLRDL